MKLPLWATIYTIFAILILCALGTWQLQRLEWKTALIEELDAEYAKDPSRHPLGSAPISFEGMIKRGTLRGLFLHDKEILLGPRTLDGKSGFHVITPFILDGDHAVFVNRGWIPADKKNQETRKESNMTREIAITGYFRKGREAPSMFVPDNNPAEESWYQLDIRQFAAAREIDNIAADSIFMLEKNPQSAAYPVQIAAQWYPPNNHLHYALFWFTMAGVLLVIYYLRFVRKEKHE